MLFASNNNFSLAIGSIMTSFIHFVVFSLVGLVDSNCTIILRIIIFRKISKDFMISYMSIFSVGSNLEPPTHGEI